MFRCFAVFRCSQDDYLLEERALVYSRIPKHKEALEIYAYRLKDFQMAEEYCDMVYNQEMDGFRDQLGLTAEILSPRSLSTLNRRRQEAGQVFLILLKVLLKPKQGQPQIDPCIRILKKNFKKIDPMKVCCKRFLFMFDVDIDVMLMFIIRH